VREKREKTKGKRKCFRQTGRGRKRGLYKKAREEKIAPREKASHIGGKKEKKSFSHNGK